MAVRFDSFLKSGLPTYTSAQVLGAQMLLHLAFSGRLVLLLAVALCLASTTGKAQEPKRVALLIGNQGYAAEIGPLRNPHNDVLFVGAALARLGFNIGSPLRDANREQILLAVHDFADRLRAAGPSAVGFLYYSGHGIAIGGENLLVPVNVRGASLREFEISGVKLADIIAALNERAPHAAHFVVFDACRNNLGGTRGVRGFAPISERPGMLIAFSTSPGNTASDEGRESGPYAEALAAEIVVPGRNHDDIFFEVRKRVAATTRQEQIPWTQDGLLRQVHFGDYAAPAASPLSEARQVWAITKESTDKIVLEAFVARYKDTFYAELARARLKEVEKQKPLPTSLSAPLPPAPTLSAPRPPASAPRPPTRKVGGSNCRTETKDECKSRVCPAGRGCGLKGSGICSSENRKTICQ